jgi:hypothetical protein
MTRRIVRFEAVCRDEVIDRRDSSRHRMTPAYALHRCEPRERQEVGERSHPDVGIEENIEFFAADQLARLIRIQRQIDRTICRARDRFRRGVIARTGRITTTSYRSRESFSMMPR